MTKAFWKATWESPMASEYLEADFPGLFRLAVLVDAFWKQPSVTLAAEIRQQQQAYGLTPLDRRRLEWTVERSESAAKKRDQSPGAEVPVTVKRGRKAKPADDPRQVLRAIK
jgi:hypothetical protein